MTFGSLFAGIGGFDLGLEWAGMKCKWQVEIDKECLKDLKHHWPNVPKFEDIKEITELPYVDLICGGFPCQDISNAGKRKGITGEKSSLWKEMLRIIRVVRPKYVIVENVATLINRGLSTVLGDLAASGYDAEWQVLSAKAFGAPHLRERVFIVAYTKYFGNGENVSDTDCTGQNKQRACGKKTTHSRIRNSLPNEICNSTKQGLPDWAGGEMGQPSPLTEFERSSGREVECNFRGVAFRISRRVHRLKALGNAVVPQIVEYIGRLIIEFDKKGEKSQC